jgi:hypothetical protein
VCYEFVIQDLSIVVQVEKIMYGWYKISFYYNKCTSGIQNNVLHVIICKSGLVKVYSLDNDNYKIVTK